MTFLDRFIPQLDFVDVRRGSDEGRDSAMGGLEGGAEESALAIEQLRANMEAARRMGDAASAEMWRKQLERAESESLG